MTADWRALRASPWYFSAAGWPWPSWYLEAAPQAKLWTSESWAPQKTAAGCGKALMRLTYEVRDCGHSADGPRGCLDLWSSQPAGLYSVVGIRQQSLVLELVVWVLTSTRGQATGWQAGRQEMQSRQRWAETSQTHQSFRSRYSELRSKTDSPALASCSKSGSGMSGFAVQVSPRLSWSPESP